MSPHRLRQTRESLYLIGLLTLAVALAQVPVEFTRDGSIEFTPEEKAWLTAHDGKIVIGTYQGLPMSFVDETGKLSGMSIDYLHLIEQRLGIKFVLDHRRTVADVLQGLRDGSLDAAPMLTPTPERAEYLLFTEGIMTGALNIVVRQGTWKHLTLEQMRGLRVAVGDNYASHEFLKKYYPELELIPVPDMLGGLRLLVTGEVDALVGEMGAISSFIGRENLANLHVAGDVPYRDADAIAVAKDEPILHGVLQKALAGISPAERERIWERWIHRWDQPLYLEPSFWRFVTITLGAVGFLFGAVVLWNKALKQQVRARTADIAEANRRLSFLAETSALLSETLETERTYTRLAEMCVRELADWCVIDLIEDGRIRRVAGSHVDPRKRPTLDAMVDRFPPKVEGRSPASRVLRDGAPILFTEINEEVLQSGTENEEHRSLLRELGIRTAMAVPLVVRGEIIGVLTLGSGRPGRQYGKPELELAREVARRAATALDNARLYREAQDAIRARDVFLMVAAHELRTPLTPLKLRLERLQGMVRDASNGTLHAGPVLKQLTMLEAQARKLGALVEQLIEVSQLGSAPLQLERQQVDLGQVVRDVVARFQDPLSPTGTPVEVRVDGPAAGFWDRAALERVSTNLLSNAIKFGLGMPVEVRVAAEPDQVTLTVRDHGIGLPDEAGARVFEKFERAVSERHYGGLGLGLYISRQIVEAHGGTISVKSTPGEGATFTVVLPRELPFAGWSPQPSSAMG